MSFLSVKAKRWIFNEKFCLGDGFCRGTYLPKIWASPLPPSQKVVSGKSGWGQIDEHCWFNNVGTNVEPFDIPSQQCGNVCDKHNHNNFVFWFLSNILAQKIVSGDVHQN